ncbi:hypothetical protein JCM17961_50450 [Endothiovibrio diazotrophicus]
MTPFHSAERFSFSYNANKKMATIMMYETEYPTVPECITEKTLDNPDIR